MSTGSSGNSGEKRENKQQPALHVEGILMLLAIPGCATLEVQPENKAEVVMKSGDVVHLFYGGSNETSAVFCPGETVKVYRQESRKRLRYIEQGTVEITHLIDENYVEGKVLVGNVKTGYVARKGNIGCLGIHSHQKNRTNGGHPIHFSSIS